MNENVAQIYSCIFKSICLFASVMECEREHDNVPVVYQVFRLFGFNYVRNSSVGSYLVNVLKQSRKHLAFQ